MYIHHQKLLDHQIKEGGMSLACSTYGQEENLYKVLFTTFRMKDNLEEQDIDRRIVLKQMFKI
jgi:hypothetical protein